MFKRLTFKTLNFALLASLVMSRSVSQCDELQKFVEKNEGKEEIIRSCETNNNGDITNLEVKAFHDEYNNELEQESIDKIFSYDTLESLEFEYSPNNISLEQFPFNKLSNLKELSIYTGHYDEVIDSEGEGEGDDNTGRWIRGTISENVIKSLSPSLKKLKISGIEITQENVNEIASLTQLEELVLINLNLNASELDFDGFKNLNKVTKLGITEGNRIEKNALEVVTKFTNVQELELGGSLHYLEPLDNESLEILKKVKILKSLQLYMRKENILAMTDICTLTNVEKVLNDDGRVIVECSSASPSPSPSPSPSTKISTNGRCGKEDGSCPEGNCCSRYGWCGTTSAHCGSGCQSEFGICH